MKLTKKEREVVLDALSGVDIEMFAQESTMSESAYEKAVESAEAKIEGAS